MSTDTTATSGLDLRHTEGAAEAPIIMFDDVPVFGLMQGFGRLTLTAYVQEIGPDGQAGARQVVVAHLRANGHALTALRDALNGIALMDAGPTEPAGKAN